jgi:hypothetical protein
MELSTGNLVGVLPTREQALLVVAEAIKRGGESAVSTLALAYDDPSGQTDGYFIAEGQELIDLVETSQGSSTLALV